MCPCKARYGLTGMICQDIISKGIQTRQNAQNVAVHGRFGRSESDGRNGPSGIGTDARQRAQFCCSLWKTTAILLCYLDRCLVQIPGPGVIP